jgi:ubiquinone biosynthesis protein UbiJ
MLQSVRQLLLPAVQSRLLLLVNHVVSREPAAQRRLLPHAGKRLAVQLADVPGWLPAPPPMRTSITPAGLFDSGDGDAPSGDPDLTLVVSMPSPQRLIEIAAGTAAPDVRIDGAADLAADMHWLVDNLRWDIEADLSGAVGAVPARVAMEIGRAGARALRRTFAAAP